MEGPALPNLPTQYFARLEMTLSGENKTVYLEEYFDEVNNKAEVRAVGLFDAGAVSRYIASYTTGEFFLIEDGMCATIPITDSDTFAFAFQVVHGKDHLSTAQESLTFGTKFREQYLGRTTVRGIPVDHWQSCIRYPGTNNETVNIDYYFAVKNEWSLAAGVNYPVRSVFHGHGQTDDGPYQYTQNYEYIYFQDYLPLDSDAFVTPSMVYCPGRTNIKDLPRISRHFTFKAESVFASAMVVLMDMWYDYDSQISRMDIAPATMGKNEYGNDPYTEIRDFKTGVRYTIDRVLGNCTMKKLNIDITDKVNPDGDFVMKNQMQLFLLSDVNFTYVGQRKIRDILSDVWIGQNATDSLTSTFEWYFSQPSVYINSGDPKQPHPIGYRYIGNYLDNREPLKYMYNIIDYDDSATDFTAFDITPCFVDGEIRRFQFDLLTATLDEVSDYDLIPLQQALRTAAMINAQVSIIRVQEVEVDYDQKGVHTRFALLGPPTVTGDAPYTGRPDLPLDVVAQNLQNSIDAGHFKVILNSGGQQVTLSAVVGSMQELVRTRDGKLVLVQDLKTSTPISPIVMTPETMPRDYTSPLTFGNLPPQGYSSGAVAGIAIAMTLVGLGGGAGIVWIVVRKRTGQSLFQMKRLNEYTNHI